jgi:hypothetical protein
MSLIVAIESTRATPDRGGTIEDNRIAAFYK